MAGASCRITATWCSALAGTDAALSSDQVSATSHGSRLSTVDPVTGMISLAFVWMAMIHYTVRVFCNRPVALGAF